MCSGEIGVIVPVVAGVTIADMVGVGAPLAGTVTVSVGASVLLADMLAVLVGVLLTCTIAVSVGANVLPATAVRIIALYRVLNSYS